MALRRLQGFSRYALSVQYHGANFLGFARQGAQGEDLRTVEGALRDALSVLVGEENFENFQVSSRTDRGVHALKNTCHVDIRPRRGSGNDACSNDIVSVDSNSNERTPYESASEAPWDSERIKQGLNYHLNKNIKDSYFSDDDSSFQQKRHKLSSKRRRGVGAKNDSWLWSHYRQSIRNGLRIINVVPAPLKSPNKFFTGSPDCSDPPEIDWNVRYSATKRTYVYRILHMTGGERDFFVPFEYDRSWRITGDRVALDVGAMNFAGNFLVGTHDFSSFRGKQCQRISPVVTLHDIHVAAHQYFHPGGMGSFSRGSDPLGCLQDAPPRDGGDAPSAKLYTLTVVGESFLYRQVRNMVGCLVLVGQKKLEPEMVGEILRKRDRKAAPAMAPAHGLFLVNVDHGDLKL